MNHSHVLYDSDPNFKIDPISRNIANNSSKKTRLIQHDHNSERFTFEIPRYIEGHDMASCNLVEIHYTNTDANTKIVRGGVYTVDDLQVKSDDENAVVCSWLVPSNATQFVGQLQFLVRFSCVNETTGKLEYVWNTAIYSSLTVSSGIYNSDSPSDNQAPPFNFVTTVSGQILKFFVGTQAEYDELSVADKLGLYAIITDDKTLDEINAKVNEINAKVKEIIEQPESPSIDVSEFSDVKKNMSTLLSSTERLRGVTTTSITVRVGSVLRTAVDTAYYELFVDDATEALMLDVGDEIYYHLMADDYEYAKVTEKEDGMFTLKCAKSGNFAQNSGNSITVTLGTVSKAVKAKVLEPTVLTPYQGRISITKTGTYLVCLKQTDTEGNVNYYTDLIVIADLNVPCISLKDGASDMKPSANYASAFHELNAGGSSTSLTYEILYAYRIA